MFAHHLGIDLFGMELAPETFGEHVMAFAITSVLLALMIYGAYAGYRDLRGWVLRRREAARL